MKTKSLILSILCLLAMWQMKGQVPSGPLSPNGLLDTVFDRFGNKYSLNDLVIDTSATPAGGPAHRTYLLCNSGYFDLFFETGCGMDGSGSPDADRRAVICKVFSDLSNFINSPLAGNGGKVKIWVRNINSVMTNTAGIAGRASSFYNVPYNSTSGFGGIADNEIWKTITSGVNSYSNTTSPLVTIGGLNASNGIFYHGMITINFDASINWNTDLSQSSISGAYLDLYTVALHEATHALGFTSLIDYNGMSRFGSGYNYYSRYDLFLKNGSTPLITNTGACGSIYNYQFNSSALSNTVITPGCLNSPPTNTGVPSYSTNCTNANIYSGSTQVAIYTPSCFENGSSLSHFEDMCYPSGSAYGNDNYFVMCDLMPNGTVRRYLKPEERLVLCDLGYSTNTTYGDAPTYTYYNYGGSACSGIGVAGINDGINTNGTYAFSGNTGTAISISSILSNDYNATSFECLEDISYPSTSLSTNSGGSSTTINLTTSDAGLHLLRYVPVSSGGQRGNITYIYVFVGDAACNSGSCNMLSNGNFESNSSCGPIGLGSPASNLSCWWPLNLTPDLYVRNCTNLYLNYNYGVPCSNCDETPDTWSGSSSGNNSMLALWGNEAIQTKLITNIAPSNSYQLSFAARNSNWFSGATTTSTFCIAAYNNSTSYANLGGSSPSTVPTITTIATVTVPYNSQWNFYTIPFTSTITANYFVVYGVSPQNPGPYILLDDFSLLPTANAGQFSMPVSVFNCTNTAVVSDLEQYATITGGVFSGPGVSLSGGKYDFNPTTVGDGVHQIVYTYTNNIGCQLQAVEQVTVITMPTLTLSINTNTVCSNTSASITVNGTMYPGENILYNWLPATGLNCYTCNIVSASPTVNTTYTVSYDRGGGCVATATVFITSTGHAAGITVVTTPSIICTGQTATVTASGGVSYTGFPGTVTSSSTSTIAPTVVGAYTYTINGTTSDGCIQPVDFSFTVTPTPTLSVISTPTTLCVAQTVTSTASGASTYTWTVGSQTSYSPGIVFTPTVSGALSYTLSGASTQGCIKSISGTVTVSPLPSLSVNNPTICAGQSTTLTASGASTYYWNTGAITSSISVSPGSTSVYTVTGTSTVGCTSAKTATVTVNPLPTLSVNNPTICAGKSATLTASGASTYSWSTGATTSTISVSPSSTTVYTVTGTSAAGCSSVKTATVTVNPTPTLSVNNPTICAGKSATLTVSGASTYSWNTGAITSSISVSPGSTTIYTVTGTSAAGCSSVKTATVTVNPLPTLSVNNPTICAGQSTTLTASGASTYSWNTGATTSTISVSPGSTTIYTVTGTSAAGCSSAKTATVTVNPLPTLSVNNPTICAGQSTTLTASGASTYSWNTGATTSTISVSPGSTTVYTVTGTSAAGCSSVKTVTVTVNPLPSITITPTSTLVCKGNSASLTASGASTYTWQPGGSSSNPLSITPTASTIYTVTGTSAAGCTSTKTISITVPSLSITPSTTLICAGGGSSTLTASGGTSYTWSPGGVTNPLVVTPTVTTTYTVSSNVSGCTPTAVVTVVVSSSPAVSITNTTTTICNSSVSFTAVPTPTNVTYSWNVWDASMTSTLSVPITGSATATPTINFNNVYQNVNICATVTNTAGCSATTCTLLTACCQTPTNTTKYTNTTFTTNTSLVGSSTQKYQFSGTITVSSGTLTISTAELLLDPYTIIQVNNGARLNIDACYLHGCSAMWNGIFSIGNSTVNISSSRIEDGIRALVDSTGGSTFIVTQNYFNKNRIGILAKAAKPSTASYSINQTLFISASISPPTYPSFVPVIPNKANSSTFSSYSVSNMLYPYNTSTSYAGISLNNSNQAGATYSMIPIGHTTTGYENVFDKVQKGIEVYRSCVFIRNNVFQNIKTSITGGTNVASVYITGHSGFLACFPPSIPCQVTNTVVVGSSSLTTNTFNNNDYGIYSTGKVALGAVSNTMTSQATGIYIKENSLNVNTTGGNDVVLDKNKINQSEKGIVMTNNVNLNATISDNRINNASGPVGTYSTNVGITVAEATAPTGTLSTYAKYTIYNNYINQLYNGILSTNTYSTQISDNEVYMLPDGTGGHYQMGINSGGNRYTNIFNNTVVMSSLSSSAWWWQFGIFIDQSQIPYINCNVVDKVATAVKIQGACNTVTMTNEFVNNKLSNAYNGVWLDAGDFNGNQAYWSGATPYAADNTFSVTTQKTYVSNHANSSNSLLYTRVSTPYSVAFIDCGDDGNPPISRFIGTNNSSANGSNTCAAQISTTAKISQVNNVKLFNKARQIAKGTLNSSGFNAGNFRHLNSRYLMEHIQMQQADITDDTVLVNFMGAIHQHNIGRLYVVDSLLQLATVNDSVAIYSTLANTYNSAIVPNNGIEQNQKQFNNIYLNYLSGSINYGDLQKLRLLAVKCPYIDGHAVFQARAILAEFDQNLYYSDCPKTDTKTRRIDNSEGIDDTGEIVVYPNPTINELNVSMFVGENEKVDILIYGMMGNLIKEQAIQNQQTKIDLSLLQSGIYLYEIHKGEQSVKNGKFIIAR